MINQTWTELLTQIRKRPAMYFGSASLHALQSFIQGFRMAEDIYAVPEHRRKEINDFHWHSFETCINALHNDQQLSLNSFGLAQYAAQGKNIDTFNSSEEFAGAWEIWWQWHDEFTQTDPNANQ